VDREWTSRDKHAETLLYEYHHAMQTASGEARDMVKVQMLAAQYELSYSRALRPFFVVRSGGILGTAMIKAFLHYPGLLEFLKKRARLDNDYAEFLKAIQYDLKLDCMPSDVSLQPYKRYIRCRTLSNTSMWKVSTGASSIVFSDLA